MKVGTTIRIIASSPIRDQHGIEQYIGKEYNVKQHWKQKDTHLNKGDVKVLLEEENNKYNHLSIINSKEYIVVE